MERMGDILARSARIGARRARLDSARQPETEASSAPSTPSRISGSPRPQRGPARVTPAPRRALPTAATPDVAQAPIAAADALNAEPILELPMRRAVGAGAVRASAETPSQRREPTGGVIRRTTSRPLAASPVPAAMASRMGAGSSGMLSLGAAAQGYLNARRPMARSGGDQPDVALSMSSDDAQSTRSQLPGGMRPPTAPDVCPHCHGAGYVRLDVRVGDPSFGQAVACSCKERLLEDRRLSDLRRMSSLDAFRDKTFDTFDSALPGLREAMEVARHYAEDPHGWLVISGGYGVGKTHLAAAIAHERLANGQSVFFSIVPDLLDHLRAAFAPSSEMPYDELFDKVREAGVLVLDDLGAENATAWATEKLFQIINYRYNYRMPTVVTTNNRLLAHMDERIRSRLSDKSFVRQVSVEAADYRDRHAGRPRAPRPASQGSATRHPRGGY